MKTMNKNVVMLLAALISLSAGETVLARSKKAKEHKHHGGHKRHNANEKRHDRVMLMEQYRAMHQVELERAMEAGQFADLYKSPAWGVESLFHDKKWELSVNADYSYACDSYGSSGGGSNSNVTRLTFGDQAIKLQDILLASRLVAQNAPGVTESDVFDYIFALGAGSSHLKVTADNIFTLIGKAESYGVDLALSRYFFSNNISVGIDLPVLYKQNRLKMDYDFPASNKLVKLGSIYNVTIGGGALVPGVGSPFLARYGNNPQRYLKDILAAKGINELGGSAAGLGDVSMFVSGHINSAHLINWLSVLAGKCQLAKSNPCKSFGHLTLAMVVLQNCQSLVTRWSPTKSIATHTFRSALAAACLRMLTVVCQN